MIQGIGTRSLLAGTALGSGITLCAVFLGPAALASGWTSVLSASGLAVAAALTLTDAAWVLRAKASARPTLLPDEALAKLPQAHTPRQWLHDRGFDRIKDEDIPASLRIYLMQDLNSLAGYIDSPIDTRLGEPIKLLSLAFAIQGAGIDVQKFPDWSDGILGRLATAMRLAEGQDRLSALLEIGDRVRLAFLRDQKVGKLYDIALQRHGTLETFMMDLLDHARRRRAVGMGEFTWLKLANRNLWYALTSLGRATYFVEGLAAAAHYQAELAAGHALGEAQVDGAIEALMAIHREQREEGMRA